MQLEKTCGINLIGRYGTSVSSRGRTLTTKSWASTWGRHHLPPRLGRNVGADGHLHNANTKYLMTSRVSSRPRHGKETTCFMVRCHAPCYGKCITATITFTTCGAAAWTICSSAQHLFFFGNEYQHSFHNQDRGTRMRTISPGAPKCLPLNSLTTSMMCSRTSAAGPSMARRNTAALATV